MQRGGKRGSIASSFILSTFLKEGGSEGSPFFVNCYYLTKSL